MWVPDPRSAQVRWAIVTALVVGALGTGCPQPIKDDGSDGGADASFTPPGHDGGDGSISADAGMDACVPLSCDQVPAACGAVADGCGGTLSCTCPYALSCSSASCACASPSFVSRIAETGSGYTGLYTSSVLDASGTLHAAFADGDDGFKYLRLPTRAASYQPLIEQVEKGIAVTGTSVAVDPAGVVHVVYYKWTSTGGNFWDAEIWYARRAVDGAWTKARVTTGGTMLYVRGDYAAIALDPAGGLHLLYYSFTYSRADLWYASSPNGTGWVTELVAMGTDIGNNWTSAGTVTLKADGDGTWHALYLDYAARELRLARRPMGGAWTKRAQPLDAPMVSGDWAGAFSSMAFDGAGTLHVAWSVEGADATSLWYGTLTGADVFAERRVDPALAQNTRVGLYPALAIDASGGVHVTYFDGAAADLKYAWRATDTAAFSVEIAQSQGAVGSHSALAVDSSGTAHVLFFELVSQANGTGQLRYATRCR